jgi:hypothetical protein
MAIYPTYQRFLKLWKSVIFPVIKKNVPVFSYFHVCDETYTVDINTELTQYDMEALISVIQSALIAKGYEVEPNYDYNATLTILSKDRDTFAPCIDLNINFFEYEDDEILEMDDQRFKDWDFNSDYIDFISARGLSDNYDNIRKAPTKLKKAYCDWVRESDNMSHLWVEIIPVNM